MPSNQVDMCIVHNPTISLCTTHLFEVLAELGVRCTRVGLGHTDTFNPRRYPAKWHLFIGAVSVAPLPQNYIVWQIEQIKSPHFKPAYTKLLARATYTWHFSPQSRAWLGSMFDRSWVLPFPCGALKSASTGTPDVHDKTPPRILFYGALNPRRNRILKYLREQFGVALKIVCVFGEELVQAIRSAEVVINIHYYDSASLELSRFNEVLGLDRPVVSEDCVDQDACNKHNYTPKHGEGGVTFAPLIKDDLSNMDSFVECIRSVLKTHPACVSASYHTRIRSIGKQVVTRALVPLGLQEFPYPVDLPPNKMLCLHLPETPFRLSAFLRQKHAPRADTYDIYPGFKESPGWKGCAKSYYNIIWNAKRLGLPHVVVFEDDCEFPDGFESTLKGVFDFLATLDEWHIFNGCIADLPSDTNIQILQENEGIHFVQVDKMHSMVLNIYHRSVYDKILAWDLDTTSAEQPQSISTSNAFARHENRHHTPVPWCSASTVKSTLWGKNLHVEYCRMFKESHDLIEKAVVTHKSRLAANDATDE